MESSKNSALIDAFKGIFKAFSSILEIVTFSETANDFHALNYKALAISADSHFSHLV
ncbi:hypothetical protein HPG69_010389 [Diceros bicornis minor]|uniref:Uncharacterized protein n=1 Tax=Diceros bicornis minor TaxID=77932 RepID=A0A7J7F7V2_DICBM|nr:hypothetical protein HPG69_010389 [Diceros bicornis minor]